MAGARTSQTQAVRLSGTRVLLVEDEFYIADDLRRALAGSGAEVIGPVPTVGKAQAAIDAGGFDGAVLDLNLHGESAEPVADRLASLGIPFVIATGYGSGALDDRFKAVPRIEKPFDPQAVLGLIAGGSEAGAH